MTARTEPPTPSTRQNLMAAAFSTATRMMARFAISAQDAAVAYVGAGIGLVDRETGCRILREFLAAMEAGAADREVTH